MKITGLTKIYGKTAALSDIDLQFSDGEITAVLGESGAGKTTLLNAIADLTDHQGSIEGAGAVSYLFQRAKLLPNLTVRDNLKFVLPENLWNEIEAMLCRVGLKGKEDRRPHELSGGEAQRVAIARAFLYPHDVLLMDEPFSSLDLLLKKSLIALVTELWAESKKTIIFVTHDVHEAVLLAHRAIVLRDGRIAGEVSVDRPYPRDFLTHYEEEQLLISALMERA